jgi:hypothetical protein
VKTDFKVCFQIQLVYRYITAPLGMLIINFLGPKWLSRDVDPEAEAADALTVTMGTMNMMEDDFDVKAVNGGHGGFPALADTAMHQSLRKARDHVVSTSPSKLPHTIRASIVSLVGLYTLNAVDP